VSSGQIRYAAVGTTRGRRGFSPSSGDGFKWCPQRTFQAASTRSRRARYYELKARFDQRSAPTKRAKNERLDQAIAGAAGDGSAFLCQGRQAERADCFETDAHELQTPGRSIRLSGVSRSGRERPSKVFGAPPIATAIVKWYGVFAVNGLSVYHDSGPHRVGLVVVDPWWASGVPSP